MKFVLDSEFCGFEFLIRLAFISILVTNVMSMLFNTQLYVGDNFV